MPYGDALVHQALPLIGFFPICNRFAGLLIVRDTVAGVQLLFLFSSWQIVCSRPSSFTKVSLVRAQPVTNQSDAGQCQSRVHIVSESTSR